MANGGGWGGVRSYNCKVVRRISQRQLWKFGKGESKMVAFGEAGVHERRLGLEKTFTCRKDVCLAQTVKWGGRCETKDRGEGRGDALRGCGHCKKLLT